jgi:hypothetical protein
MPTILVIYESAVASAMRCLAAVSAVAIMSIATCALPQAEIMKNSTEAAATRHSSSENQYSAAELFSRLAEHGHWQEAHLDGFSVIRTYRVKDDKGKMLAEEVVVMQYKTPGTKTFTTIAANGSQFIRAYVFNQLMKREAARARRQDRDSYITPNNYTFEPLGKGQIGNTYCSVVHAIPKRKEVYLFEGKIWIDDQDFAIVKVAGHLAKSPSHWIKRVDFVRQYQKIDGFWLPVRQRSIAKVRLYGTKILTIDYRSYAVDAGKVRVQARH